MKRATGRGIVGLAAAVLIACTLACTASALVVHRPNGQFLGITLHRGVAPSSLRGLTPAASGLTPLASTGNADYNGGPVLHSSAPYLIVWTPSGFSLPGNAGQLLDRYFKDAAADSGKSSNVYGVIRQYTDGSGFADYRQTFSSAQAIVDTHAYPSSGCSVTKTTYYPRCITDAQIQTELARLIAADGLPTGLGPTYFVVTPPQVNVCTDASTCASNLFCAYHSAFQETDGAQVLYSADPFFLSTASTTKDPEQNPKLCQQDAYTTQIQEPNGDLADVAISYTSHENNETITDPLGTGWFDQATGNEIADNCAAYGTTIDPATGQNPDAYAPTLGGSPGAGNLFDQLIDGDPYYTQSVWSNGDGNCELRPTAGTLSANFTSTGATPGTPATFDPGATASSYPLSSETWRFGDGSAAVFATASAPVSHTFSAPGTYSVTLTVLDDRGNESAVTKPVVVSSPPNAAFSYSPRPALRRGAVRFDATGSSEPEPGVGLSSFTWRFGDGGTASGLRPHHTFRHTGTYTVTLTVRNSDGAAATISHRVKVVLPIARVRVHVKGTRATVLVKVNGAGRISLRGKTIRRKRAWTARFVVTGPGGRVHLTIRFKSGSGARETKRVTVVFA